MEREGGKLKRGSEYGQDGEAGKDGMHLTDTSTSRGSGTENSNLSRYFNQKGHNLGNWILCNHFGKARQADCGPTPRNKQHCRMGT